MPTADDDAAPPPALQPHLFAGDRVLWHAVALPRSRLMRRLGWPWSTPVRRVLKVGALLVGATVAGIAWMIAMGDQPPRTLQVLLIAMIPLLMFGLPTALLFVAMILFDAWAQRITYGLVTRANGQLVAWRISSQRVERFLVRRVPRADLERLDWGQVEAERRPQGLREERRVVWERVADPEEAATLAEAALRAQPPPPPAPTPP